MAIGELMPTLKIAARSSRSAIFLLLVAPLILLNGSRAKRNRMRRRFNNFFVTGDHRLYSIQTKSTGDPMTDFVMTNITVDDIPSSASPVAAYLLWATVAASGNQTAGLTGAQFRNSDLAPVTTVVTGTSPCWSNGGGTGGGSGRTEYLYRADVIKLFPVVDGKYAINGTHSLKLVDVGGGGNQVPFTLGATLLVVFRDVKEPYRAIVVYDGSFVMNQGSDFVTQTMRGFYQASDISVGKTVYGDRRRSRRLLRPGSREREGPWRKRVQRAILGTSRFFIQ